MVTKVKGTTKRKREEAEVEEVKEEEADDVQGKEEEEEESDDIEEESDDIEAEGEEEEEDWEEEEDNVERNTLDPVKAEDGDLKAVESSDGEGNDDDEDFDEEEDEGTGGIKLDVDKDAAEVEANIGFFDPTDGDRANVEQLLYNSGKNSYGGVDLVKLSTKICEQTRVGTMIRLENDPDCIGFITCFNFFQFGELFGPLRQLLFRSVSQEDVQKLKAFLPKYEDGKTGLIVCERVLNFPSELIPKLQEALFDEISWATEDEPTEKLRDSFKFKNYVYTTEVLMSSIGTSKSAKSKKKQKKKRKRQKMAQNVAAPPPEFVRPEDDVIYKHASLKILFSIPGQAPIKGGLIRRRMAMFFSSSSVPQIRKEIETLMQELN